MNVTAPILHAGLQSVLDTALDAVIVMDRDGMVIGWNGHATRLFGWDWCDVRGLRLSDTIIPPAYRDKHEQALARYLATGEGGLLNNHVEVSAIHRDGTEFPIELSVTASDQFGGPLFIGFLRDISERKAIAERHQRQLQESDHRVKNILTVVAAIARQTARASSSFDDFNEAFSGRLESLARAHQLLVGKVWDSVALSALAEQVLGADVADNRARFGGPSVLLKPRHVLGLSMVLHELYTNAVKYGALCGDEGHVALDWRVDGDELELTWMETGGFCDVDGHSSGFGHRMIALSVKSDLGGTIERDWRPSGLRAVLRFPLKD
jgi:PAS domain S-box-containing protein